MTGGLFGASADLFDNARPGYPDAAVAWAVPERVGRTLDVGAGTGKLTAALVSRADEIIAVDPSDAMLTHLRNQLPTVRTLVGTAEATGLPDAHVDAVVAGAAWHWFARPAADAELARVLRTGGVLAVLWNPLHPDDPVQHVFRDARVATGLGPDEFDPAVVLDGHWFGPTERADFTTTQSVTALTLLDQLASRSYVLDLDPPRRQAVLAAARERLAALAGGASLTVRYRTTVLRAIRCGH